MKVGSHKRPHIVRIHSYEKFRIGKFIEKENKLVVAHGIGGIGIGGGLEWRVIPNRKGVSFVVDGYVLNLDCADGYPTRGMYEIH